MDRYDNTADFEPLPLWQLALAWFGLGALSLIITLALLYCALQGFLWLFDMLVDR